jgi:hypothetical protein
MAGQIQQAIPETLEETQQRIIRETLEEILDGLKMQPKFRKDGSPVNLEVCLLGCIEKLRKPMEFSEIMRVVESLVPFLGEYFDYPPCYEIMCDQYMKLVR